MHRAARLVSILGLSSILAACPGPVPSSGDTGAAAAPDAGGAFPPDGAFAADAATPGDSGQLSADAAGPGADAAAAPTDAGTPDTGAPLPNIRQALDCGTIPGNAPGPGELQRHILDKAKFPDALCNDGTTAVLYFRPYQGAANRNKWLINLRGGGSCSSGPSCAARWCSCDVGKCPYASETTRFDTGTMTTAKAASLAGSGLMERDLAYFNPMEGFNHVRLDYCSSDLWAAARRDMPFEAQHPMTGATVSFSVHFLGAKVLEAGIATLRRDGVPALSYTLGAAPAELPDLDEATQVVFAGDSAGGGGLVANLDRLAALLAAANTTCAAGGACPSVAAILDAAVGPSLEPLDFTTSKFAAKGITTYAQYVENLRKGRAEFNAVDDESCLSWHAANAPGTIDRCSEYSHLLRHHVTTPFFVRMALADGNIVSNYQEAGYTDPVLGAFTPAVFATVLQRELAAFPNLPTTAEEGAAMKVAPGVFAPLCTKHDTIWDNNEVYGVTITPAGGTPLKLYGVLVPWSTGGSPTAVLSQDPAGADTVCQ